MISCIVKIISIKLSDFFLLKINLKFYLQRKVVLLVLVLQCLPTNDASITFLEPFNLFYALNYWQPASTMEHASSIFPAEGQEIQFIYL